MLNPTVSSRALVVVDVDAPAHEVLAQALARANLSIQSRSRRRNFLGLQ